MLIFVGIFTYNKIHKNVALVDSSQSCSQDKTQTFKYIENDNDPSYMSTFLVLDCNKGILEGYMFGPYPAQEHGLLYYSSKLEDIKIKNNMILFRIPGRNFFSEPFDLETYKDSLLNSVGFSRNELKFSGTIENNKITLECVADPLECYSERMDFNIKD